MLRSDRSSPHSLANLQSGQIMAALGPIAAFILLCVTAVKSASLPTVPDCQGNDEFWKGGSSYTYAYSSVVEGAAVGTTDKVTGVKIDCTVELSAVGQCRYILKVKQCNLGESPGASNTFTPHARSSDFGQKMSQNPVSFLMTNGEVRNLIVSENEPTYILNIKRGIISTLQGSKKDGSREEGSLRTDVHGTCPVKYTGSGNHIESHKELTNCHFPSRHDWALSPASLMWNMTFIQIWFMNASADCTYDLTADSLQKVTCHERHAIRLESSQYTKNGVQTNVHTTLELQQTKPDRTQFDRNLKGKEVTGIEFVWEPEPEATSVPKDFETKALKLAHDIASTAHNEIRPLTITLFDELVHLLRESSDVQSFTEKVYSCQFPCDSIEEEVSRALTRDALVTCNTVACMKAVKWLALNNHLTDNYFNRMLYRLTKLRITNPAFIDEIFQICKERPTRMCLLSLTSVIYTYQYANKDIKPTEIAPGARSTVQFLTKMIGNNCNPKQVLQELDYHPRIERIILVLKAIGNLGDVAAKEAGPVVKTLQNCATSKFLPKNATLEAIKAFRRITPNNQVNNFLLKTILSDEKLPVEHRISAYSVLADHNDNVQLFEDIAEILKKEKTQQLGNFITMHMRNVQTYGDAGLETLKTSMRTAMANHEDVFVVKGTRPLTSSRHREWAAFFNSPYMRDVRSRFGIDVSSKALYESFSFIPREVMVNLTSTLFGKTFNTATLSASLNGLEPFVEALLGPQGVLRSKEALMDLVQTAKDQGLDAVQQRLLDPVSFLQQEWTPHFDNAIETRLTKIHNSVINEYKKAHPSATLSLKLYGNELAFTSLDLIKDRILSFIENDVSNINWEEPHKYHVHRVVRFMEGNYQVPTAAGLPLFMGTEADLALSIRASLKADIFGLLQEPRSLNAEWDLNPSFAVTFLNRMLVKVPEFTKFGFQANNTAFRSRQRSGSLVYEDGDLTLNIKAPTRPQQVINLFRTNQLIRGDSIEEIPDMNIKRVNSESCYPSSYTGVKFCRVKSYANVTYDSNKPWSLLAGNAEYRAWFEMDDRGLTDYTIHLKRTEDDTNKQYEFDFKAPGTKWRREIKGLYKRNKQTNELYLDVKVPEKPHFRLNVERKRRGDDDYVTHIDGMFRPDRPFTFHAERKLEEERHKGKAPDAEVKVIEAELKLPERTYTWSRTLKDFGQKKELNHMFTFESKTPDSYMQRILPEMFWENNRKARIQLHSDINLLSGVSWGRTTSSYIKLPKSILQVETERISDAPERRGLHFNITKRSLPDYNVQSFLNFTYDMSSNPIDGGASTRRIHEARLYIPHVRWGLDIARDMNRVDNKITAVLRRDKARDNRLEVKDLTNTDVWDVTFTLHHHNVSAARGDVYPTPRERTLEFSLVYPRDGSPQKLSYKGKIINDEGQRNAIRSFKTDSTIDSTYWNIHWKANTDYMRSNQKVYLDHNSAITSLRTQKTATYKAHLDATYGLPIDFTQNFQSSFYTFDEKLKVRKNQGAGKVDLTLEIDANSPIWDGLNLHLKQDVQLDPSSMSTETMKFTHKLVDIDVKAEFKLPFGSHYKKEFNIKSKNSVLPTMKWIMDHHDNRYYSVRVEYPDDPEGNNIYGILEIEPSLKGATLKVTHDSKAHGNETALQYSLALVTPDLAVVKYDVDEGALRTAAKVYADRFQRTWDAWTAIKSDPEHPMNKLLRPIVKTTLAEFQRELGERIQQRRLAIRAAVREAIQSFEPIYGPTLTVLKNLLAGAERLLLFTESDRPQTFTGWAFDYFDLRDRLQAYLIRLFDRITTRVGSLRTTSSDGSVAINHGLHWNSLVELPRVTPKFYRKINTYQTGTRFSKPDLERNRVAIVYGGNHVYTFDGKSYDHPGFVNKDCVYILAHDFVFRHYSVLLQENAVHLLFPEVAVSVDKQGNVKVNGSKTTSEVPISSYNKHVTVRLLHDNSVHIHSDYGLDADIFPESGTAIFYLDFWNHNRTLGLLGNNDNEAMNDFKLPNGKISTEVNEFVVPYEMSGRSVCSDRNRLQALQQKPCTLMGILTCEVFNERHHSSLYQCFDVVDPRPFSASCSSDPNCRTGKACDSVIAYAAACKANNVHVRIPKDCAACEHGHSWNVDGDKTAEVVVVVQDHEKNSAYGKRVKGIEGLLDNLEKTLKRSGYTSIKYGLVSYHHDEPYAHTLKGKMFAPLKDVIEGLKSISFTSGGHHTCAMDALHLAASAYPYSPESAHIMLLSTSSDMPSMGLFGNRDMSKVHRQLEVNGITLYTFADYDGVPDNKKVYGVRGDGYVIPQPKKGDGYMSYPSGMYAKLSSGTKGAVFQARYLSENDAKLFTEATKEILAKISKEVGHCKHCHCHSHDVLFTHSQCHPGDC